LKKLVADSAKCTGCGVCEEVCSKAYYKVADKEKSAIRIIKQVQREPGPSASSDLGPDNAVPANETDPCFIITVCDQCGVCKENCSIMALKTSENGVVRLDKKICTGCLVCVGECLRDYMRYHDDLPTPFKCVACGLCAKQCPAGAIWLEP